MRGEGAETAEERGQQPRKDRKAPFPGKNEPSGPNGGKKSAYWKGNITVGIDIMKFNLLIASHEGEGCLGDPDGSWP